MNSLSRIILFTAALSIPLSSPASSLRENYNKLNEEGKHAEIESLLKKAASEEKPSAEYYALAGNYWWQQSKMINLSTKPSEQGDLSLRDLKTGKEVGSLSTEARVNPEIRKKALSILTKGAKTYPERADILLGLAHMQSEMNLQDEYVSTLTTLLESCGSMPSKMCWTENGKLPGPLDRFIPKTVHHYTAKLYQQETQKTDIQCATTVQNAHSNIS